MKVFIIGTGLIGGSFALDIQQEYSEAIIYGIDTNSRHLKEALEQGVIHKEATMNDLPLADIVFLTIPVDIALAVLPKVLDLISDDALVIDVGSTKQRICDVVKEHPKRRNFLAAHPIAGTEFSGPKAALQGLYKDKTNIICEVEKTAFKLQEKALEIFSKIGMRIRYMDAVSHDKHIAYVSHLSHISSFMLGKTVIEKEKNEKNIFDLAGSGFESTVRLAKSLPETWTPIFLQNKNNLVLAIDEYISNLNALKKIIENNDSNKLSSILNNTNRIKEILSNKLENGK